MNVLMSITPSVIDGPINRLVFETSVTNVLVPELRPEDVVIMDNLPSHTGPALPPAVQSGFRHHRERLLEAEGAPAKGR